MAAGPAIRTHIPLADDELPDIYHLAAEGRHGSSPGLRTIKTADGTVLTLTATVEAEVTEYFTALFHGRHVASPTGPVDSGHTFQPDQTLFPAFLEDPPSLTKDQRLSLEQPFTMEELEATVDSAAPHKSPGLDGLSYEFYRATLQEVGPSLVAAFNAMMASCRPPFAKG